MKDILTLTYSSKNKDILNNRSRNNILYSKMKDILTFTYATIFVDVLQWSSPYVNRGIFEVKIF